MIVLMMRNLSGNSPIIGLTLSATGLYFFVLGFLPGLFATAVYDDTGGLLPIIEIKGIDDEGGALPDAAVSI